MQSFHWKVLRKGTLAAVLGVGVMLAHSPDVRANDDDRGDESQIKRGFAIAPVPLNLRGKNRALVGLGSYIVNAQGVCNDCHTIPPFAAGGDPYIGEPKKINAAVYLGGGTPFGPFVSRNLTPDKSGRPLGGATFAEFLQIMRTGIDVDNVPPSPLLQVMPWPVYQNMTDRDLRAIYEYLSAIPCVEGDPGVAPPGPPTTGRCK